MLTITLERGHVTASVAADLLGVTRQRVNQLLKEGRINGAFLMDCGDGRELWVVPRNSLNNIKFRRKRNATDRFRKAEAVGSLPGRA